jgi:hypothetical protein
VHTYNQLTKPYPNNRANYPIADRFSPLFVPGFFHVCEVLVEFVGGLGIECALAAVSGEVCLEGDLGVV